MNASLRQKEHWSQPGEESLSLRIQNPSSESVEFKTDRAVDVRNFLLRSAAMAGRAGSWLWRTVVGHESMIRENALEASRKEEELRALRAELRRTMFMKI